MSNKVEYVDLGLPSGILWSKYRFSFRYLKKNGIAPSFENMEELRKYCSSTISRIYSSINGNYINSELLYLHCIKFK